MKHSRLILALLLGLALLLSACGAEKASPTATQPAASGDTGAAKATEVAKATEPAVAKPTNTSAPEPTAVPTAVPPTDTPEPTEEPDPGIAAVSSGLPEDISSFRSTMDVTVEGKTADGTPVSQTFGIVTEWVKEPPAQHVTLTGTFPGTEELTGGAEDASIEMYVVEGTMYMSMMGTWLSVPADESASELTSTGFLTSKEMLDDLKDAKYEGKTDYNGVRTRHYTFDEKSFDLTKLSEGMTVERAEGNVYVAVDGDYVVHMDLEMEGTKIGIPVGEEGQEVEEGTMKIVVDLTDINAPIEITVPPEALTASQAPEDLPIPDDAEDVQYVGMMGMTTFNSPKTPQEVSDWYKAEMPNAGWTAGETSEMTDFYTLEFTKETRKASFMISKDSTTGKTSVLITIAEQ